MNQILWFCVLILSFSFLMIFFRLWGKNGLFAWMAISGILANIQVTKTVVIFGLEATLGNIISATSFLATDILSEFYSKKDSEKAIILGFSSIIVMTVLMQFSVFFIPSSSDLAHESIKNIFSMMPRITIASVIAYLISNFTDINVYEYLKNKTSGKFLWLRNNLSTWISQIIDSLIFTTIAFYGVYEKRVLIQIIISTYVFKWIVSVADTPVIYLAKKTVAGGKIYDLKH